MITGQITTMPIAEYISEQDSNIRRYVNKYLSMDSGWGFWDETQACFHAGHDTEQEALEAQAQYVTTFIIGVMED